MSDNETPSLNRTLIKVVNIYQQVIQDMDRVLDIVSAITDDTDILNTIIVVKQNNIARLTVTQKLIDDATNELKAQEVLNTIGNTIH